MQPHSNNLEFVQLPRLSPASASKLLPSKIHVYGSLPHTVFVKEQYHLNRCRFFLDPTLTVDSRVQTLCTVFLTRGVLFFIKK
jgi:hypothetical protein